MTTEKDNRHIGNWYILILGLPKPIEPIIIAPGIAIRPLENELSIFDLAAAGAVGFRGWSVLEPVAQRCECEIESAGDEALIPGYDALNRAWLASALLCLRGFTGHVCVAASAYSWNVVAGHQERSSGNFMQQASEESVQAAVFNPRTALPPFRGDLLDFHINYLETKSNNKNTLLDEALWVRAKFEDFNQLCTSNETFRFALEASNDWRYSTSRRAAVARLWSGIEAIFSIKSELVYRISSYAASLLSPRGEQRKTRFEEIKRLYNRRSKVVHGGPLSEDQIQVAIDDSFVLLRDLLLYCIEIGGTPNKDKIQDALFG